MLTGEFDFHRAVSYQCSTATIAQKRTVIELEALDRQADRQAEGRRSASLNAPTFVAGRATFYM